ncbi:pentapeptide repeat-containing protein [Kordiimonas lacus]|uniref:Pentapeptide repeat-containing protein n=1 Tax=Kordiimonas lacus TaxID=637679 RepID=A0A1G6Y806_9PROT|nr:pentapeptide repeat-containing protein [Kordiimonas lacus]SDD86391.1 hypothetical protein SAMN04488071_1517 [Kordiimonas lacus]
MPEDTKPDETQYTDPETGKPIIYADNVPEILRGLTEGNCGFELDDPELTKMDTKMSAIQRAEQGVVLWKRWVQWAELVEQRWTIDEERDGLIFRGIKESGDIGHTIEFNAQFPRTVAAHLCNLREFIFPCHVKFNSINFVRRVSFEDAIFCSGVSFCNTIFDQGGSFGSTVFKASADFRHAKFRGLSTSFNGAHFLDFVDFSYAEFHENVGFIQSKFEDAACFDESKFLSNASFNESIFSGAMRCVKTRFENSFNANDCVFLGYANWSGATFMRSVNLRNSAFLFRSNFVNCDFKGHVDLDWTRFGTMKQVTKNESKAVPNFGGAKFAVPPNLGYTLVEAPSLRATRNLWEKLKLSCGMDVNSFRVSDAKVMSKLRRLQELAADGHHHLAEKRFFRAELLCRRGHEATGWREIMMINLFELFSECGLNFWRPIDWLIRVNILFGLCYLALTQQGPLELTPDTAIVSICFLGLSIWRPKAFVPLFGAMFFFVYWQWGDWTFVNVSGETWRELLIYCGSNSLPVIGLTSDSYQVAVEYLFGLPHQVPDPVRVLAFIHNAVSAVFLFFALLAIRNYFKLG